MSEDKSDNSGTQGPSGPITVPVSPPDLLIRSAPTGHLPARDPGSGIGGSVPTQHLPSSNPSPGGGGGGGGGSSDGGSEGGKD